MPRAGMDGYNAPRTAIYRNEVYDLNRMWRILLLCEPKRGRVEACHASRQSWGRLSTIVDRQSRFSHFHPSRALHCASLQRIDLRNVPTCTGIRI